VAEAEELKTAFLASLSHEFRTPLNAILGYLDMLEEASSSEEARHIRALVRRHSGAMLAMLDNALYLAEFRLGRIFADPEVFALTPLVESVAREAEILWGRPGVRLVLALDPTAGEVHTDKRAVRQIVRNLLTNAMCFTEEGEVILRTRVLSDPEVVEIVVADTVSGVSALHRARLFEDYVAVQPEAFGPHQLGLGIGLAVAKQLGDLIGSTLEIETGEAKSSVFRLRFPKRAPTPTRETTRNARSSVPAAAAATPIVRQLVPASKKRVFRCPPFPAILGAITRALHDPMVDDREVRRAVRTDEAISLSLIHYANAAWMARRSTATTVEEALATVGLAGLRSLVLTKFVHSLFPRWDRVEEFLWEHALASALAASLQRPGVNPATEEFYLCGLLHNIGKAVINADDPGRYVDVLARVSEGGEEFCQAEESVLGVTHPAIGAEFVREAAVPNTIKETILYHHEPEAASGGVDAMCRSVLLADAVAYRVSPCWAAIYGSREEPDWIRRRIDSGEHGLTVEAVAALEPLVSNELDHLRALLRL
jgi:HD-like signal output (HDOD) protein